MRTKRHCSPAKRSSGDRRQLRVDAWLERRAERQQQRRRSDAQDGQPRTAATRRGSLAVPASFEQQILRALVARRDLERRQRLRFGLGALAALADSSRRDRCGRRPDRPASSATTARNSRMAASSSFALHREPAERRVRFGVERIDRDDPLVDRLGAARDR